MEKCKLCGQPMPNLLIAAAPDLLEALREVAEYRASLDWKDAGYWDADSRLDKIIQAAIAKAEGRA